MGLAALFEKLGCRDEGLTRREATARLKTFGPNALPRPKRPGLPLLFVRQFRNPLVYLLLAAAVLSLLVGEWLDAAFIFAVLLLNAGIGTFQEWQAQESAAALEQLVPQKALVCREGRWQNINSHDLVPGDLVRLESGSTVSADIRLIQVEDARVDESLLTGESFAVEKSATEGLEIGIGIGSRANMLFAGTTFLRGRASGVVVATGRTTEIGQIAEILAHGSDKPLPLLRQLEVFSRRLGWATVILIGLIGAAQAAQGLPLITVFLVAIALAVAAIPEGLPVAIAVALAFATRRMHRRRVIVRALPAVEGLGACTLIASDKTGTLTKNELTVASIVPIEAGQPGAKITLAVEGLAEQGDRLNGLLQRDGKRLEDEPFAALLRLAESATICNEGRLQVTETGRARLGDTVDTAFLDFAYRLGLDLDALQNPARQAGRIPYEPERRFAAVISRPDVASGDSSGATVHVKGALETLLPLCGNLASNAAVLAAQQDLAAAGQRVLAVARGEKSELAAGTEPEAALQDLQLLGIVGLIDPLRPEVPEAAARCREAGISLRMITGDHPATALAIARQIGIAERPEDVITGRELKASSDGGNAAADFDRLVAGKTVFARVEPLQKLDIVRSFQRCGEVVAVTGDGVNDAPALKAADIGVAMGRGGTDVARGAADLILTDDNLASIVAGVEEGRIAYDNIRKLVYLLIATGLGEIVLFILAVIFAFPVPLFAVQLLWLNLVTNGIQHIALALEKGEEGVLKRKPRPPREQIFERRMISQVLLAGVYMGGMSFVAYAWFLKQGMPIDEARNLVLLLMVLFENAHALNARSERQSLFRLRLDANWFLLAAVVGAQGLHIAALFPPGLSDILRAQPIAFLDWLLVAALAASLILVMEFYKQATARGNSGA